MSAPRDATRRLRRQLTTPAAVPAVSLRLATVTAVTAPTVSIALDGTTITGVSRLASYTPTVNDVVFVLQAGTDLLVIGKAAT